MARPVQKSIKEYARGLAGGLLFGIPLLYTMEMWWTGFIAGPERLAAAFVVTCALLYLYNFYAGIRRDRALVEVIIDSVEELGLAMVLAALLLWIVGRLSPDMQVSEVIGRLTVEIMAVAIGISIGRAQLGSGGNDKGSDNGGSQSHTHALPGRLAIGACGAVLVCLNVAPTEEILQIGVEAPPHALLVLALMSFALVFVVLYLSDFLGTHRRPKQTTFEMFKGGVAMYAVALGSSAFLLWFFGRLVGLAQSVAAGCVIVLALPAALGASAGKLLLHAGESPK